MSVHIDRNVQGWERTASIAGGFLLLGKGLRKGGIGGLLQVAMGGLAVARGFTGQCAAKRMLADALNEQPHATARVPHGAPLEDSAASAVQGTTVVGDDVISAPRPVPGTRQPGL